MHQISRNSKAKSTNRWFDGNRRVHTPNDILIGSSVFAQLNQQTHRPRCIGSNRPHRWTPCVQCDLIRGGSMGGYNTIQYNTKFVKRHVAVASEAPRCALTWFRRRTPLATTPPLHVRSPPTFQPWLLLCHHASRCNEASVQGTFPRSDDPDMNGARGGRPTHASESIPAQRAGCRLPAVIISAAVAAAATAAALCKQQQARTRCIMH